MKFVLLAIALLAAGTQAKSLSRGASLTYDNCGGNWPIMLTYLAVSPDPLVIPGNLTFSLTIDGSVPIVSPAPGNFTLTKLNDDGTVDTMPCIQTPNFPIGSCYYDDVCLITNTLFDNGNNCPQAFIDAGQPCTCPFNAGGLSVVGATVSLDSSFSVLPSGTYNINFALYNAGGGQDGCINIGGDLIFN